MYSNFFNITVQTDDIVIIDAKFQLNQTEEPKLVSRVTMTKANALALQKTLTEILKEGTAH